LTSTYTAVNGTSAVRVVIFQYFENTSLQPGGTTIQSSVFQTNTAANAYLSPFNHDYHGSYAILYDETHILSLNGPDGVFRNVVVKPQRKRIDYVASVTNGKNHVYLALICDSAQASAPVCDYYARVNYTDA